MTLQHDVSTMIMDDANPVCSVNYHALSDSLCVRNHKAQQKAAVREPNAGGNHRAGIAAVRGRIEDRHDDGKQDDKQLEPEVQLVNAHGGPSGNENC